MRGINIESGHVVKAGLKRVEAIVLSIFIASVGIQIFSPLMEGRAESFGLSDVRVDDAVTDNWDEIEPDIAVNSTGVIFVVFTSNIFGDDDVFIAMSIDGGASFLGYIRINDDPIASGDNQLEPTIAINSTDMIFVAWRDDRLGDDDIFVSNSTDGMTWGDGLLNDNDVRINDDGIGNGNAQREPAIAINSTDMIFVVWADDRLGDDDIFISNSTNGTAWGDGILNDNDVRINDDGIGNFMDQREPAIAINSTDMIFVAWRDDRRGDDDIFISNSTDGTTWGDGLLNDNDVRINDDGINNGNAQREPAITINNTDMIFVAWRDDRLLVDDDIFISNSTDGMTWGDGLLNNNDARINDDAIGNGVNQEEAAIAIGNLGDILVVWSDERKGNWDIYFSKSIDGGLSWSTPNDRVDNPPGPGSLQQFPSLAINGTDVFVVWQDNRDAALNGFDIYFSKSSRIEPSVSQLKYIIVVPYGPINLGVAQTRGYRAYGIDGDGYLNTTWTPSWSTTNGLGAVTPTGGSALNGWTADYTAGLVLGIDNITASNGTVTGRSMVNIMAGPLFRIELTPWPGPVTLSPTGIQSFTALGYDQFGNLNTTWTPTWGTTNGLGIVTPTGGSAATGWLADYAAGTIAGPDNITVVNGSVMNSTQLEIIPGPLFRIVLTPWPGPVTLDPTGNQSFIALGYDQYGNLITTWSPTWGTTDGLGTVTPTGGSAATGWTADYTAGDVAGTDNITVYSGLIGNQSEIEIIPSPAPEPLAYIVLIPTGPTDLSAAGTLSYIALGFDRFGNLNTTWTPTWDTTDDLGTVTSTGGSAKTGWTVDYTAGNVVGMDNITVANGTVMNQSQINVLSPRLPTSSVDPLPQYQITSTINIVYTATDNSGAGLLEVELWYRRDGGTWTLYGTFGADNATIPFTAPTDGFYEFYTRARDNVGGYESLPPTPDTSTTVDTTAPTSIFTSPVSDASEVPINATLKIKFSESMDRATTENAFSLTDGVQTWDKNDGTIEWLDDQTMVFTPNFKLSRGQTYTVKITSAAKDISGNQMSEDYTWQFSTPIEPQTGGAAEPTSEFLILPWILLIIALIVILLLLFLLMKKRKERCPKCDAPVSKDAVICDSCGHFFKEGEEPPPPDESEEIPPPPEELSEEVPPPPEEPPGEVPPPEKVPLPSEEVPLPEEPPGTPTSPEEPYDEPPPPEP